MKNGDTRSQDEVAVFSLLDRGFEDLSIGITKSQLESLTALVALLHDWSGRINLTGHRSPEEIASRLVLDAAASANALPELSTAESVADLGTGAGFPGLPIAILFPTVAVQLVDSREKRHHFRRAAIRQLGLGNVESVIGRAEILEPKLSDIVIAQAMTQPDEALALMDRWAAPGATLALPASEGADRPESLPEYAPIELREYLVPISNIQRKLWVAKKLT